jgi:tetratricopeptide (TPR) repeat protein
LASRGLLSAAGASLAVAAAGCSSSDDRGAGGATLAEYREIEPELIDRAQRFTARGDKHLADGRLVDAIEAYGRATRTFDSFGPAWNNLGVALMEAERYREAEAAFRRAARLAPRDYRPVFNRGLLYFNRGFAREAAPVFERAISIDPAQLAPLWYAIRTDILLGDISDDTIANIERAMMLETDERFLEKLRLERERMQRLLERQEELEEDGAERGALPDDRAIDLLEAESGVPMSQPTPMEVGGGAEGETESDDAGDTNGGDTDTSGDDVATTDSR